MHVAVQKLQIVKENSPAKASIDGYSKSGPRLKALVERIDECYAMLFFVNRSLFLSC